MPPSQQDDVEEELRALGERRRRHEQEARDLATDTARAVQRVLRTKVVTMTLAASLLGLDRTYLYRRARNV